MHTRASTISRSLVLCIILSISGRLFSVKNLSIALNKSIVTSSTEDHM